jgi:hypothetical protein
VLALALQVRIHVAPAAISAGSAKHMQLMHIATEGLISLFSALSLGC